MKFPSITMAALVAVELATKTTNAFMMPKHSAISFVGNKKQTTKTTRLFLEQQQSSSSSSSDNKDQLFDAILREYDTTSDNDHPMMNAVVQRRQVLLQVPDTSATASATLVSAVTAAEEALATSTRPANWDEEHEDEEATATAATAEEGAADKAADVFDNKMLSPKLKLEMERKQAAIIAKQEGRRPETAWDRLVADRGFNDMIVIIGVPSLIAYAIGKYILRKSTSFVGDTGEDFLDQYASEMLYHDGNLKELELCDEEYKKKMLWMGPNRNEYMLNAFFEQYAKKKPVSCAGIRTISHVFTLYKLSEKKAAKTVAQICANLGTEKVSSVLKILFMTKRILKSPEAQAELEPIKAIVASTYRGMPNPLEFVDQTLHGMGEAAYRAEVTAGGENQTELTKGWKVLGLKKSEAEAIFDKASETNFLSDKEEHYRSQKWNFDKNGNQVLEDGTVIKLDNAKDDDDDDDDAPTGDVFECGNCGYTLFIAEGRSFKFFGDDFTCPECGAPKDQFEGRMLGE